MVGTGVDGRMKTSNALESIIFVVIAIAISGAFLPILFADSSFNYVDGSVGYEITLGAFYALAGVCALIHRRQAFAVIRRSPILLTLLSFVCLSAIWAETPGLVARRALALFGTTLFGVLLATRFDLPDRLNLLSKALRISALLSLLVVAVLPKYGIASDIHSGDWVGIFGEKNGLGAMMALGVLVEWYLPTKKVNKIVWLLIYGVLIVKADSIAPMASLVATFLIVKTFEKLRIRYRVPTITVSLLVLVIGGVFTVVGFATGLLQYTSGRTATLSGRTELWGILLNSIATHPLLGYGYGDFWGGASKEFYDVTRQTGWIPMYAHNGYVEITISLGIVGLFLACCFLVKGTYRAIQRAELRDSIQDMWPLAFLIYFLIHNMAECTIMWKNSLEWALCVATVLDIMPRRARNAPATDFNDEVQNVLTPSRGFA
jgi:exopolysaccharide production protein ExoQ